MQSPPSFCLSIHQFTLINLWTKWPLTLTFCKCMGHGHISRCNEGQSQTLKVYVEGRNAVGGQSSILNQGQFSSYSINFKFLPLHRLTCVSLFHHSTSNMWFFGCIWVYVLNGASISLAVFAGFLSVTNTHRQTHKHTNRQTRLC